MEIRWGACQGHGALSGYDNMNKRSMEVCLCRPFVRSPLPVGQTPGPTRHTSTMASEPKKDVQLKLLLSAAVDLVQHAADEVDGLQHAYYSLSPGSSTNYVSLRFVRLPGMETCLLSTNRINQVQVPVTFNRVAMKPSFSTTHRL